MIEKVMTNLEFAKKLMDIANGGYKTLYIMGCFGAPMNEKNKERYSNNYEYNKSREKLIKSASADTFGFDCVNLVKGLIWGWNGDLSKTYGGAVPKSHGLNDIGTETMIKVCDEVNNGFDKLEVGELMWLKGHVGVYVGEMDGGHLVVECTPAWKNCVQFSSGNSDISGYPRRDWAKHGKIPWIEYVKESDDEDGGATYVGTQLMMLNDEEAELGGVYQHEVSIKETIKTSDDEKKGFDWKNLIERALWTFGEGFVVTLAGLLVAGVDGASWKAILASACMGGLSALKTWIQNRISKG